MALQTCSIAKQADLFAENKDKTTSKSKDMNEDYNYEEIEDYLNNQLDAEQKTSFEQRVQKDKGFAKTVHLHKSIIQEIESLGAKEQFVKTIEDVEQMLDEQNFFGDSANFEDQEDQELIKGIKSFGEEEQFLENIKNIDQELEEKDFFKKINPPTEIKASVKKQETKIRRFPIRQLIAAAASIVLVIGLWFFIRPNNIDTKILFANNYTSPVDNISPAIQDELSEIGFGKNDKVALQLLQTGINAYKEKDYSQAIGILEGFIKTYPNSSFQNAAKYFLGNAYLSNNNITNAITIFTQIANNNSHPNQNDAKWYLALTHLKIKNLDVAKKYLKELQTENYNLTKVNKLLEVLL